MPSCGRAGYTVAVAATIPCRKGATVKNYLPRIALAFLFTVLVACGEPRPPDEYVVATAIAAGQEVNGLEDEMKAALREHERLWDEVEVGPQAKARAKIEDAKFLESRGQHERAATIREEAHASFTVNPLVIRANLATSTYRSAQSAYSEAQAAFTKLLEDLERDGLMELYEEAIRTPYWSPEKTQGARP